MNKSFRYFIFFLFFVSMQSCGPTNQKQPVKLDQFELSPDHAHPSAKELLRSEIYWNPFNEMTPFGNDAGSDAFHGFRVWRMEHKNDSPSLFIRTLLEEWDLPSFDINATDTATIQTYIKSNESADSTTLQAVIPALKVYFQQQADREGKEFDETAFRASISTDIGNMGGTYLMEMDEAIIAVGFGQWILEGAINAEVKELTQKALQRELTPEILSEWGAHAEARRNVLLQMLSDVEKMK
jgi:uncharacterized protein YfeS